jgi:hypothetical protein
MKLTKHWFAGIVLGIAALAACDTVRAQAWQPVSSTDNEVVTTDWQQRALHRPQQSQQSLQWQAPQGPFSSNEQIVEQPQDAGQLQRPAGQYQTARRSFYDNTAVDGASTPYEPRAVGRRQATADGAEVIPPGQVQFEAMASDGAFAGDAGCANCGTQACECDGCGKGTPASDGCCKFGYEIFDGPCGGCFRTLTIAAGAQGFKGPVDLGVNGNFGLNEGINLGGPLGDPWNFGYQIGANFLQSDFSRGATGQLSNGESFALSARDQTFVTAAIFRRALCGGLQGGVAYDYLHDSYFEQYDLQQIRSEIGLVIDDCYEIGYYGANGVATKKLHDQPNVTLDPTDMYTIYIRRSCQNGGDARIWGGASGNGDGLLGADLWVPLGRSFALQNRINYLIPKQGKSADGQQHESWGMMMQLVWYPGQMALCQHKNPYRPMFNVADNSLFMVDRLTNH